MINALPTGWSDDNGIKIFNNVTGAFVTYQPGTGVSAIVDGVPGPSSGFLPMFVKDFRADHPTIPIYIIHNAKGSQGIAEWDYPSGSMWVQTDAIVQAALLALRALGVPTTNTVFFWAQGEGDSTSQALGQAYGPALSDLISDVRTHWTGSPTSKVLIQRTYRPAQFNSIYVRDLQASVAYADANVYLMNADDLAGDGLHFTQAGYEPGGHRLYDLYSGDADLALSIPVTPTIATSASLNAAENSTAVTTLTADAEIVAYSITAGADQAKFSINASSGALTFAVAPDYETPTDANTDGVYQVTVGALNGRGNTGTKALSVTVTDVSEAVDGVTEMNAIIAQAVVLGATSTTTGNTAWYNAGEDFIAAMKVAGLWSKVSAMHVLCAPEWATARVNWTIPGTYDAVAPTSLGTFTAKDGYAGNGTNGQSDTHPNGWAPYPTQADRNVMGIIFRNSSVGSGTMQIGNTASGGPALRRARAQLGSGNANYTSPDTTGFHGAIRQNSSTAIRIFKNDGSFHTSVAITDQAVAGTGFSSFPGVSTGVLNFVIWIKGQLSDADMDTIHDLGETMYAAMLAS